MFDLSHVYDLLDFDEWLPKEPSTTESGTQRNRNDTHPTINEIPEGERNNTLYRIGRHLKEYGERVILESLLGVNQLCKPPVKEEEVRRIAHNCATQPNRPEFAKEANATEQQVTEPFTLGLGNFLAQHFPPITYYIEGIMSDEGGGWLGGEEKIGKTLYALEEALCLALGLPVCGRFPVPLRHKVLFMEEEDSPRRTHGRHSHACRVYSKRRSRALQR